MVKKITLSDVKLATPPAAMHTTHPIQHDANHLKLRDFVFTRMMYAAAERDRRLPRYIQVDKQIYGWIRLAKEDEKRKAKTDDTGHPYAIPQHMPLTLLHLQDKMAYYSGIFAPTRGMFQHVGDAEEQVKGQTLLKVMNQHAQHAGYYTELMRALLDLNKYQIGGLLVEWDMEPGYEVVRGSQGLETTPKVVWEGNRTKAIDLYNAFWQPGVKPTQVDLKSEYFATVEPITYYEIQKKGSSGEWLNVEAALRSPKQSQTEANIGHRTSFYRYPPKELRLGEDVLSASGGPWQYLAAGNSNFADLESQQGISELMNVWIWLNPYEHSLVVRDKENRVKRNRLELWKLQFINAQWLVSAEHVTNVHGRIPVSIGLMSNDSLDEWQKSPAEIMRSLQDFLSFLLNTHISGVRKNLWGMIFYNPDMIDLSSIPEGEVAARIPVKPTGQDIPLDRAVYHADNQVDTRQTMQDFQNLLGVIQQLMPTQALPSQIAGIDRAVDRQVAAVVQGGNRPMQMQARFIDETLLRNWRTLLFFNILQFQEDVDLPLDDGNTEKVNADSFSGVSLQYLLGQGLKALDKQLVAQEFQRMILAIMQSQIAAQEFDVVALIDAWSDYLDIEIDLTQFRKQAPAAPAQGAIDPATGQPVSPSPQVPTPTTANPNGIL